MLQILIKSKRLTQEQLDGALKLQKQKDVPLRKILIENNLISEAELLPLLSKQLYIPTLHLSKYRFDPDVINLVSQHIARRYCVIPISRMGSTLTVAMSDPLNIFALDDLRILTGCNIDTVLCSEEEIIKAIDTYYQGQQEEMDGILSQEGVAPVSEQVEILKQDTIELSEAIKESQAAPIVKLVDLMLAQALKKRASDIHVEPVQEGLRIRYRIDGSLHDMFRLPKINQNAVLARIKIISDLDITEARKPQDGRFRVKLEKKEVIIQYRTGIDLNKLGLELYKAILTLDRYNPEDEKKLLSYVSNLPNTHYLIRNIWNIELELVVSNYQEYYQIIESLKKEFPHVIRTVDSVLMITDEWTPGFKNLLKIPKSTG